MRKIAPLFLLSSLFLACSPVTSQSSTSPSESPSSSLPPTSEESSSSGSASSSASSSNSGSSEGTTEVFYHEFNQDDFQAKGYETIAGSTEIGGLTWEFTKPPFVGQSVDGGSNRVE